MSLLKHLFGARKTPAQVRSLYAAVVASGRDPHWYIEGQVPDTIDGRFDMIAALLALVLLRLEADGEPSREMAVALTETFVDDMDGSLRQIGIGDLVVSKHVGKMMGALGGRLGAFRDAIANGDGLTGPIRRNIFHEAPPSEEALRYVVTRLDQFRARLDSADSAQIRAGTLPAL